MLWKNNLTSSVFHLAALLLFGVFLTLSAHQDCWTLLACQSCHLLDRNRVPVSLSLCPWVQVICLSHYPVLLSHSSTSSSQCRPVGSHFLPVYHSPLLTRRGHGSIVCVPWLVLPNGFPNLVPLSAAYPPTPTPQLPFALLCPMPAEDQKLTAADIDTWWSNMCCVCLCMLSPFVLIDNILSVSLFD